MHLIINGDSGSVTPSNDSRNSGGSSILGFFKG